MKIVSVRDARANFSDLLGLVYYTQQPVVVQRRGKAFAVVVSPTQFKQLEKIKAEGWAVIDELRARNANKNPDEVYREVTKIVEEVRQEMYEKEQKESKKRRR